MLETEPIFASLANILRNWSNLKPVPAALEQFELEPLERKIMLMQLTEALQFVHQNANIIHRNLEPSSIYLTAEVRLC